MYPTLAWLLACLALLASTVGAQDPTLGSYLWEYPAQTISGCGGSPYTITAQAWQIYPCIYTVKYTVQGTPALSDFGFGLGNNYKALGSTGQRNVTVSGCSSTWNSAASVDDPCYSGGPFAAWQASSDLVTINNNKVCGENATFWVTGQYASLGTSGTAAFTDGSSCWTCNKVPYVLENATTPDACPPPPSPPSPFPSFSSAPSAPPRTSPAFRPAVSSIPEHSPSRSNSTSVGSTGSSNAGAIAGGVIGGIVGLAALVALGGLAAGAAYFLYKRWISKPSAMGAHSATADTMEESAGDNIML